MRTAFLLVSMIVGTHSASASELIPVVLKTHVVIVNHGNGPITYYVSNTGNSGWVPMQTQPKHKAEFKVEQQFFICVGTLVGGRTQTVLYRLSGGKRYSIDWNRTRGVWDVFELPDER